MKHQYMKLQTASGIEHGPVIVLPTSEIGGRTMTRSVVRANLTRQGTIMTYDKARVGFIVPVPRSLDEARNILRDAPSCPEDRAMKTEVRQRLLRGEIVGIFCGRRRKVMENIPEAFIVPYPHTVILADFIADRLWEAAEEIGP